MKLALVIAILTGSLAIAASVLFIGRWQISGIAYGYGYNNADLKGGIHPRDVEEVAVFRLDRWTGRIDECFEKAASFNDGAAGVYCFTPLAAKADSANRNSTQ